MVPGWDIRAGMKHHNLKLELINGIVDCSYVSDD